MKIGFTGTRRLDQVSDERKQNLRECLAGIAGRSVYASVIDFHHGDCVGADAFAHEIALGLEMAITIHPPLNTKHRAFSQGYTFLRPPDEYLKRNRHIVDECETLIALPRDPKVHQIRSGTWSTIRYARSRRKRVLII